KCIEIAKRSRSTELLPGAYDGLGLALMDQGKLDEAESAFQSAVQSAVAGKVRSSEAAAYSNLGTLASRKKDYAQAHDYLLKAHATYLQANMTADADRIQKRIDKLPASR